MMLGGADDAVFPLPHRPHRNPGLLRHFCLGQVGFNALHMELVAQGFGIDGNELPTTISVLGIIIFHPCGTLCNTQQLTQPPLALSVPLSRFASRVGGGSAFFVRHRGGAAFFAQDLAGVGHLYIAQRVFVVAQFAFLQDCVRWYSEQRDFESFALDDSMIF